jgi:predicted RNase H-like HicB family nuclease
VLYENSRFFYLRSHFLDSSIQLHIGKLSEGVYLATSDDVPGLVAQGRTIAETIGIARDIARILIEERNLAGSLKPARDVLDVPLFVGF